GNVFDTDDKALKVLKETFLELWRGTRFVARLKEEFFNIINPTAEKNTRGVYVTLEETAKEQDQVDRINRKFIGDDKPSRDTKSNAKPSRPQKMTEEQKKQKYGDLYKSPEE